MKKVLIGLLALSAVSMANGSNEDYQKLNVRITNVSESSKAYHSNSIGYIQSNNLKIQGLTTYTENNNQAIESNADQINELTSGVKASAEVANRDRKSNALRAKAIIGEVSKNSERIQRLEDNNISSAPTAQNNAELARIENTSLERDNKINTRLTGISDKTNANRAGIIENGSTIKKLKISGIQNSNQTKANEEGIHINTSDIARNTRIIGQENTRLLDQNKRIIENDKNVKNVASVTTANADLINSNNKNIQNVALVTTANADLIDSNSKNIQNVALVTTANADLIDSNSKNIQNVASVTTANADLIDSNSKNIQNVALVTTANDEGIVANTNAIDNLKTSEIANANQTRTNEGAIAANIQTNNNNTIINGNEIKALDTRTFNNERAIADNRRTTATNTENIKNNSHKIDMNSNKIDSVQEESRQGISRVSAIAGIKYQDMTTGQAQIGVGYGNYKSESSIAIGTAVQASENLMLNGAVSGTQGNNASPVYSAGASYKFNLFI